MEKLQPGREGGIVVEAALGLAICERVGNLVIRDTGDGGIPMKRT
jgi:hypothetical protein